MKANKKIIALCAGGLALVVAVTVAAVAITRKKNGQTLTVSFYALSNKEKTALQSSLEYLNAQQEKPYTIVYGETTKKADVIFTGSGSEAESVMQSVPAKNSGKVFFAPESTELFSSSLKGKAQKNADGGITMLPLLSDLMIVDIDRTMLSATGTETIITWDDVESFAVKAKRLSDSPIVFAGRDDSTLIDVIGALTESLASARQLSQAAQQLRSVESEGGTNLEQRYYEAVSLLSNEPSAPLYAATHTLARWIERGILHPDALNLTLADVYNYMDFRTAAVALLTLSEHRDISYESIARYVTIYYPSELRAELRSFSSRTVVAIPLTAQRQKLSFVEQLAQTSVQEKLAKESGLAPADSFCQPADKQADDVRYWIAGTNTPSTPLSAEVCASPEARTALANALRAYIRGL